MAHVLGAFAFKILFFELLGQSAQLKIYSEGPNLQTVTWLRALNSSKPLGQEICMGWKPPVCSDHQQKAVVGTEVLLAPSTLQAELFGLVCIT